MIHVYPVNDLEEHDTEHSAICKCNPKVEIVEGEILIIHNAFDLREVVEKAEEILKQPLIR